MDAHRNVADAERQFAATMSGLMLGDAGCDLSDVLRELRSIAVIEIWRREAPCDALTADDCAGWVLAGALRKFLITDDGQRRIVDLLMTGDVFGLPAEATAQYSLQAIGDATVTLRTTRRRLHALADQWPAIQHVLRDRAFIAMARLERHSLAQGCTTALEKVSTYLLEMLSRLSPQQEGVLVLPISRYDIADHLGIAVETVSRSITALCRAGLISLDSPRCITIINVRGFKSDCRRRVTCMHGRSCGSRAPAASRQLRALNRC